MGFDLLLFNPSALTNTQAVSGIVGCNELTAKYGLVLTEAQAVALTRTRLQSLTENGRVEFNSGIVDKIIAGFCNSPHISTHNYEETLHELIEMFYYYKNETLDLISDDDLITYMKTAFNGLCQGSLELLSGRELYNLARNLRFGHSTYYSDDIHEDLEDEYGEY